MGGPNFTLSAPTASGAPAVASQDFAQDEAAKAADRHAETAAKLGAVHDVAIEASDLSKKELNHIVAMKSQVPGGDLLACVPYYMSHLYESCHRTSACANVRTDLRQVEAGATNAALAARGAVDATEAARAAEKKAQAAEEAARAAKTAALELKEETRRHAECVNELTIKYAVQVFVRYFSCTRI